MVTLKTFFWRAVKTSCGFPTPPLAISMGNVRRQLELRPGLFYRLYTKLFRRMLTTSDGLRYANIDFWVTQGPVLGDTDFPRNINYCSLTGDRKKCWEMLDVLSIVEYHHRTTWWSQKFINFVICVIYLLDFL